MKVLVVHGSERGGTAGLAERVAAALREHGHVADVQAARDVRDVKPYGAVVIGGALYAFHWHEDARRFVLRHAKALRERETWFFSSGPLDDSASQREIPPVGEVAQLMAYVSARGHATFGGRLLPDAKGFPASAMAKKNAGDWRDWPRVDAWAGQLAAALDAPLPERAAPTPLPSRAAPLILCFFTGVTALLGGVALMAAPDGGIVQMPTSALAHSPFSSFLWPGILLFTLVGVLNVFAAWRLALRGTYAPFVAFAAGCSITIWIVTEMAMLRSFHWLQAGYLAIGIATVATAGAQLRALFAEWSEGAKEQKKAQGEAAHA